MIKLKKINTLYANNATYTVEVSKLEDQADGFKSAPQELTIDSVFNGKIGTEANIGTYSYYKFTTSSIGEYRVLVNNLSLDEDITVYLYEHNDFSTDLVYPVYDDMFDALQKKQFALDADTTYYLEVHNVNGSTAITYDIKVSKIITVNREGFINVPVTITDLDTHSGKVGTDTEWEDYSYYIFTPSLGDKTYSIVVSNVSNADDLDIYVYSDSKYSDSMGNSFGGGSSGDILNIDLLDGETYYIKIENLFGNYNVTFDLDIN